MSGFLESLSESARSDLELFVKEIVERRISERAEGRSPWLTVRQAAEYLQWPVGRIYKLTAAGAIPHRRNGSRILLHRAELDEWLDGYREGPYPLSHGHT